MLSWTVSTNESRTIATFPPDLIPTDLQFLPRVSGTLGKHGDLFLITSTDGRFHIVNRSGRIERSVEAHQGAILAGQWSNDGSSLLTAGEDGFIKIWSRGGMLRSIIVSSDNSIYGASWSPDSQSLVYTQGKALVIKSLAPNTKPIKWRAHDELILCVAWSAANDMIVSGGEDGRYRLWDNQGRSLYSSGLHDNPITSLAWTPKGDLFAVGSYNTIRLCDYSGWSRSLDKPATVGSIYSLSWSADGTQLAGACASGQVLLAHVIERTCVYQHYTATVSERKTVKIQNILDGSEEILDVADRVIQMALRYGHLVLTTPTQCHIYSSSNWNTPTIFELKDGSVVLLLLCEKHLLLVERSTVGVYNYQGRLIASPRWANMRLDSLGAPQVSISNDCLAVRDATDTNDFAVVHIIDLGSTRNVSTDNSSNIQHTMNIVQLALDQAGPASERRAAILDKNKDLFLVLVRSSYKIFAKLAGQIQSFLWNSEENMIAAIQDTRLVVWYCPAANFDRDLLRFSSMQYDSADLGKNPKLHDFVGNSVAIRRTDGSLLNIPISPYPIIIHSFVQNNKWRDALNLARLIDETSLWALLAVLASKINSDRLEIAEEAYAVIGQYDKVLYIQKIKNLSKAQQAAGVAILLGQNKLAESILLHNGMVYHAILNHITLYNWTSALDLATKHKTHIDTVLYMREKYLKLLNKVEVNSEFLKWKERVSIDEEKILEKMEEESQKSINQSKN